MAVLEAAAAGAGLKVLFDQLAKGIGYAYEKATKAHLVGAFARWHEKELGATLHQRTDRVRFVKTLWRVDDTQDLIDFYTQPHVQFEQTRCVVEDHSSFRYDGNILVKGTVGQGKSLLLRYLAIRELI